MRLAAAIICVFVTTPPTFAGQPISESMVQCSALYSVAGSWMNSNEKAARLYALSDTWADAARGRAEAEGVRNAATYVDGLWGQKCAEVSDKGRLYVFTEDFRDWMNYCRALARETGLPTRP